MGRAVLYARVSTEDQATDEKTSLSEQLLALRHYADEKGYEVHKEIDEDISGRKRHTPGLTEIQDMAEDGEIDTVLVYKWNRMARTVKRFESFMARMKVFDVDVVSLDGQSNKTAQGRAMNRMMAVFSELQRDDLIATMMDGKRGRARRGLIVPGKRAPYGFRYDSAAGTYRVVEPDMAVVRRIFSWIARKELTMRGAKRRLESEGIPSPNGSEFWSASRIRDFIRGDVYKPHTYDEMAELLSADALATLDPGGLYGIQWYNRVKWERPEDDEDGPIRKHHNDRQDWIPVPVADSGIPRETVDAAREAIQGGVWPSKAADRYWPLKGIAFCPCGRRISPRTVKHHKYYACTAYIRDGKAACEYGKNYRALELESEVRQFVNDLIQNPDVLRASVEAEAQKLKDEMRRPEVRIKGYTEQLNELDRKRSNYQDQAAEGEHVMSRAELRSKLADLDSQREAIEDELENLNATNERLEYLNNLPDMIEEYLAELPRLMAAPVRQSDGHESNGLEPYTVTPETAPERSEVDEDEMARKYRSLYDDLGLHVHKKPDGTTEIKGNFDTKVSKDCVSQRCTALAMTS